jgi:hypothetical protein
MNSVSSSLTEREASRCIGIVSCKNSASSVYSVLRHSFVITHSVFVILFAICNLPFAIPAATVTGNLLDLSLSPLNTKLLFSPTNTVLINSSGLSAGPPKIATTTAGAFSIVLDAGDYTVLLPLVPTRNPFRIAVPDSTASINITNLMNPPATYIYTNSSAGYRPPLHVNTTSVAVASPDGETPLLDGSCTIPANTLAARNVLVIEAFGSFSDPDLTSPTATLTLKLAGAAVISQSKTIVNGNWHLRTLLTVRSPGPTATLASTMLITCDNPSALPFSCDTQSSTIDTTTSLDLSLTAIIDNLSGAESITCEQLVITLL